jgi:hypothetical protein
MTAAFLYGILLGWCSAALVAVIVTLPRRRALPPATKKQIQRAARANRAVLSDRRRFIPLPTDDFSDHEDTR